MELVMRISNSLTPILQRSWPLLLLTLAILACLKAILIWVILPLAVKYGWAPYATFTDHYHAIAQNLLDGHGYRITPDTAETMVRAPGNVLFLAALFGLFGKSLTAVKVANLFLGLATAGIVFFLTRKITKNNLLSVIACVIFSLHPAVLMLESRAGVESLFIFCLSLFVLFLYRALGEETLKSFFLAGLVFGLVILVRSSPILVVVFLFFYLLYIYRNAYPLKTSVIKTGVFVVAMLIVVSPWMVRNYSLAGTPTFSESMLGVGAYQGYYMTKSMNEEKPYGARNQDAARQQSIIAASRGVRFKENGYWDFFYSIEDELSYNKVLLQHTVKAYQESPLLFIKHCFYNSLRFWFQGGTPKITLLGIILTLPILILAITGIYVALQRGQRIMPLLFVIIAIYMIHIPLIAHSRYHTPLVPFLAVLMSIGLSHRKLLGRWLEFDNNKVQLSYGTSTGQADDS